MTTNDIVSKNVFTNKGKTYQMRIYIGFIAAFLTLVVGCAANDITYLNAEGSEKDADKLLVVDCLLPGRIKRLGAGSTYVTPRRPAKLTALNCEQRGGEYVAYNQANHSSALKVWLNTAQQGDPVAQTYVGEIYEKGFGITPDYQLAALWYQKAAEQGHSRAKLNLGYLYEKGLGVTQNITLALSLYRDASGLNDTEIEFESFIDTSTAQLGNNGLGDLKNQLENEKQKLLTVNKQMTETKQILDQEREQITRDKHQLQKERKSLRKQIAKASSNKSELKKREQALKKRESSLKVRISENKTFSQDTKIYLTQAKKLLGNQPKLAKISIAGPSIQIVNPQLISMRGNSSVKIRKGTRTREIVGRINAPAGLKKLNVNNQSSKIDEKGIFRVLLSIGAKKQPVHIIAIDNQGKKAILDFNFVQSDIKTITEVIRDNPIIKASASASQFGRFHALVIGNNNYKQFPKLNTAVNDAKSVSDILNKKYGFRTTTLINANRFMILAALNRLRNKLTEKDNLLVYYAGHGELREDKELGYWLPVDAHKTNRRKWISNTAISDVINSLPVKRVLVIADSCYSGALTRSSLAQMNPNISSAERLSWLRAMAKSKARLALTSGGLSPVADTGGGNDHSLFANALLKILKANNDILEGQRLYNQLYAKVTITAANMRIDQSPEYAPIRHAGHESGEFFFLPKDNKS